MENIDRDAILLRDNVVTSSGVVFMTLSLANLATDIAWCVALMLVRAYRDIHAYLRRGARAAIELSNKFVSIRRKPKRMI